MQLVLLKKHTHGTRSLVPGDVENVSDVLGDILVRLGIARRVVDEEDNKKTTRRSAKVSRIRL